MSEWNTHYTRAKSALGYPDENLVRLLSRWMRQSEGKSAPAVLDLGCGSGRHLKLLRDLGIAYPVGSDGSFQGLEISRSAEAPVVQCFNTALPFKDQTFDAVIAWGSLHYAKKAETKIMIDEIKRVLKKEGFLFGTLRNSSDTLLRKGQEIGTNEWVTNLDDIAGSLVSFYTENEVRELFETTFFLELGSMERSSIGNLNDKVAHWVFQGRKL
jgi:SAM-dependent methyltransferase